MLQEVKEKLKFKVELVMNDKMFVEVFYANTLMSLCEQIQDAYPSAKIVGIIGT